MVIAALLTAAHGFASSPTEPPLTVHLVPHTHDDVGWLKTIDQYFSGSNNSIQYANVRGILDSVVRALTRNPARKFVYIEQAFFQRWWRELDDDAKALTRGLVERGQLAFANGGWCMHDEAATHYVGMVDQTTLGHRLLKQEFGELGVPTVAWQLDPFGHSATQAALLSAEAGMDSLFFGRVDYQDLAERRARKAAEWVWRASPSLGADAQVFTGLTGSFGGSYCWPSGLNWAESGDGGNAEPVELNEELETYNKQSRVDDFVAAATSQGAITRGRHVMFTMGCDFNYLNAEPVFANMDKIIAAVNADGRVRARYSTPAEYVAEKRAETASGAVEWPLTNGTDLFPYRDVPNAVWSGYFTSRPALKGYMRSLSSYLNMAWQLLALAHGGSAPPKGEGEGGGEGEGEGESEGGGGGEGGGEGEGEGGSIDALEDALGIAQHHDAMTGTAKQHVAFDYARRLAAGVAKAEPLVATALDTLLSGCGCGGGSGGGGRGGGSGGGAWRSCARLNETVCAATQRGGGVRLAVWNQLGRPRRELVVLPVSSAHVAVRDAKGASVPVQVFAAAESVTNYRRRTAEASWQAAFFAEVPAAGAALFSLAQGADAAAAAPAHEATVVKVEAGAAVEAAPGDEQFVTIENEHVALLFSRANGHLEAMIDKARGGATTTLNHTFCYYAASVGGQGSLDHDSGQSSGAYIFRPDDALCRPVAAEGGGTVQLEVVRGEVVSEVRQTFAPWLTQTVRLAAGERHASLEWTVGEVPLDPPPDAPASQRCVAWRGEPPLNCTQGIAPTAQGYCECAGGRRAGVVGAGGHPYFTCEEACRLHGGREVVSRFSTSLASADVLLTDSNGREMLARRRGHRPTYNLSTKEPVASNYFPVGTTAAIRDAAAATQLTLLVDRAQGGASLAPGQIELMVHRRLIKDDGRGAAEALNETEAVASYAAPQGEGGLHSGRGLVVRGTHLLSLDPLPTAAATWRPLADRLFAPPRLLFAPAPPTPAAAATAAASPIGCAPCVSGLRAPLPPNVHLLTLRPTAPGQLLLRLSHQFGIDEDPSLSRLATVDLATLFARWEVTAAEEVSLTANQNKSAILARRRLAAQWTTADGDRPHPWRQLPYNFSANSTAVLGPLEIKTFVLSVIARAEN